MSLDQSAVGYTTQSYEFKYDWKTAVLYNLGIGAQKDELEYLYEGKGPKVYPTFAVVPSFPPLIDMMGKTGGSLAQIVHGGESIRIHRPIPPEGTLASTGTIKGLYDLRKMAQVVTTTRTTCNGELLLETEASIIFRGEGGFGGDPPPKSDTPAPAEGAAPSWSEKQATLPEQALLYRLSGDVNPLHADPGFAAMVGFPQGPILHGLATYGFVARAIVKHACGGDGNKLRFFSAQFRKPVWPGEAIRTDGFDLGGGKVAVRAYAADRPEPVVGNAWAEVAS